MNREAEFAAKSLPDRLRSITNEALWDYELDAIEAAANALEAAHAVLEIHHHDIEAHAASFNEGWDEAVRQGLAEPRGKAGL